MCTFRNLSRKMIRIPMESSPFDARKHNLMILSWGFPKSFFALQIIPHTNKQELVATTTWHQINPILPLFHKICLTWSGIYLPLSQGTFISTQTNMFSASNLFSTGMQEPLLHWNSSTLLFGIQEQGIVYLSCAKINPHLTVSQIEFRCARGCQSQLWHGH